MNPEQAWQSVLGQLQMEMPRASFDTWVRDTRVQSCEDGTMTIAVPNDYARDWLESRLTSTVSRLLAGMLDCSVAVQFVVSEDVADEDATEETGDESLVSIEISNHTEYETVVRPEKIIAFPAYALRLLWEDVDHPVFWLWVGLRQSVWSLRRNSKTWHVNASRIYSNAGFSRATFWRLIPKESTWQQLRGMAAQLPVEKRYYHGRDGKPHAVANRYQVSFSPRLTTRDAYRLYTLFQEAIDEVKPEEQIPHLTAKLKELTAARAQDYLPTVHEKAETGARSLMSEVCMIIDIVRLVTGIKDTLPSELEAAADELHRRIISAFGTVIFPQYFIQVVVPHLGLTPPQASLRVLMMDRCYSNRESGEVRDTTSIPGGYETLAAWLNISRPKTIREWLSGSPMKDFIREIFPSDDHYTDRRCFQIRLDELVIPDGLVGANETHRAGAVETHRSGANETHGEAQLRPIAGAVETHRAGAIETHLKNSFKSVLNTKEINPLNPTITGRTSRSKRRVVASSWDLNRILTLNNVHPRLRDQIQKADSKALVSFVLWAVSPQGSGLKRPLSYALSQLKADPVSAGAGGAFEFFAHLSPSELLDLIDATPKTTLDQFHRKEPGCQSKHLNEWLKTMCNHAGNCPSISELRAVLFGRQIE